VLRSSLARIPSNISSASTRCLCFCFFSIKSPVGLSLFSKLWIVCVLGTLSSRNLHQNFCWHFLSDPYFTQVSYRNTCCSKVYHTMMYHTTHWEQMANGADNCAYCWQIINYHPWTTLQSMKHDAVKRSTSELLPFIPNIIGNQALSYNGKIHTHTAACGAPVTLKCRAMNQSKS
jgi:hypothetical protein